MTRPRVASPDSGSGPQHTAPAPCLAPGGARNSPSDALGGSWAGPFFTPDSSLCSHLAEGGGPNAVFFFSPTTHPSGVPRAPVCRALLSREQKRVLRPVSDARRRLRARATLTPAPPRPTWNLSANPRPWMSTRPHPRPSVPEATKDAPRGRQGRRGGGLSEPARGWSPRAALPLQAHPGKEAAVSAAKKVSMPVCTRRAGQGPHRGLLRLRPPPSPSQHLSWPARGLGVSRTQGQILTCPPTGFIPGRSVSVSLDRPPPGHLALTEPGGEKQLALG